MLKKSQKVKFVNESIKELGRYKVVGILNLGSIPDRLLQSSKNDMRGRVKFILGRKSLLKRILEGNEPTKPLAGMIYGTGAIIMSNDDPFDIYKNFKAKELRLAAKPHQTAPEDIIIKSGETSLQPGQAVTELKQAGVDVQIQKGKVVISKDKVIVKKGESISSVAAKILHTLGTMPFKAVMLPAAMVENGILFGPDTLSIDQSTTVSNISLAFGGAYELCLSAGIVNQYTVRALIEKAFRQAIGLGVEAKVYEPGVIEMLFGSAAVQARAVGSLVGDKKD